MKVKLKDKFSRTLSLILVITLILVGVVATDTYYSIDSDIAYAAESSTIGSGSYPTGAVGGATLTVGATYTFGGYSWVCAETSGNLAVLQSTGVTSGYWPGYTMSKFGNNNYYSSNIDGQDISDYNQKTKDLYAAIKAAEYTSAPYGKGLYLVSNSKAGTTSSGSQGSGHYWTALKAAAAHYSSFGATFGCAWLGTVYGSDYAWCVDSGGGVHGNGYQNNSYVVAPAFNLDTSKVSLSGTALTAATFTHSTYLNATQSITSGTEGGTVDLSKMFSSVKYADGTNAGKNASYKISSTAGSINGTTWTLPTGITSAQTVSLTITDTTSGKNLTKNVNFTVNPRAAGSISVDTPNLPEFVTVGENIDLAPYITVTGYDAGTQVDGKITSYTLSSPDGTFSGTTFTPGNVASAKTTTVTVTATGNVGNVNYNGKEAQFNLKIKPDTTGWTDRDEDVDGIGFHTYTDSTTNIEWKYKCNDDGNIQYLYTTSNVEKIISDGHVLLVPSTINGIQVIGIGGGTNDGGGTVIPFIPTTGENANNTWTSIYIPSSVSIINDGAFEANKASASIVIPGTVRRIGVDAFKGSKITSVIFNDANSLYLNTQSFAEIPTLTKVSFRGNGVTLGQRSFANDTGLTTVDIPNGTKFVGEEQNSQNDSFAFQGTTGLTLVKIDTDTVYSNIFSANKNLSKVIFGENVNTVKYDWSGTATSNADTEAATVARTTYSLNAETVFEMDKTSGGSPFGYANSLTVIGKNKDINGDSNAYNNTADPVKAKIAYLATYYQTNNEVKGYAKGTGSSITITAEGDPSSNNGVTETVTNEQTGIEAYYKGVIFTGKKLDKSKMTVYKMFDTLKNGSYETSDFYVLRTNDANTLLAVDNTNEKNAGGKYVATYTDDIIASFEEKDSITINDTDLTAGTVDVKVVVLQKDENGKIYIDHSNGHVIAFVYTVAVPVKAYTAENDFFENYGSYSSVINTVNSLKETNATLNSNITNLESQISEKNTQISDLNDQISQAEGDISALQSQKAALEQEKNLLSSQKTELESQLDKALEDYNTLVTKFAELVGSTEIGKDDFTYTDKSTGKDYVYINGKDLPYDKSTGTEKTLPSGEKVIIYEGTGDVTGNGDSSDKFYFYVKEDGVHYVTLDQDGNIMSDEVYTTTIEMMQKQAMAEINGLKKELSDINTALGNLYAALEEALGDLGMSGAITMEGDNSQSAADKINSITSMVNTLSAAYNKTNDSMRLTIAKIDIALGYGEEVRYDGKLVKIASNANYTTNGLPATIYYTITGSGDEATITYLSKDSETFSAISDQSAYETAFDTMLKANAASAVNYIKITDPVNGFKTDSADPYTDYNKAIKAFLAAFGKYSDNTETLIQTVNSICGTDIEIPGSGATTAEINTAIENSLKAINTQLSSLNNKNSSYATQYALAANSLEEFLKEFNGGQNVATIQVADGTATIVNASTDESVKGLGVTTSSTAVLITTDDKVTGVTIDGRDYYVKDNGDGTYTAMLISSEDASSITSAAKACVAELAVVRGKLDDVDDALAGLYDALENAFSQMGLTGLFGDEENSDESAADKINSISGMISIITSSYNTLQQQYGKLSDDYQTILNAVYGDYEKTAEDVTAEDVVKQIEKNQKDEIDKKVAEALENAGAISGDSEELQKNISEAIDAAAAGEAYDTTGMSQEMVAALSTISTMKGQLEGLKAQVEALQSGNEAITSMLQTLSTALGFDSVQDQATIIAAIQSLRDQVSTLTETNDKLTSEKALLVAANEKLTAENTALKASGSQGSNDASYQTGYNAGYSAGFTAGSKTSTNSSNPADYQTGYNAGYNAATLALGGSNNDKVSSLTTQVNTLTKENATLSSTIEVYENGIDDLYEEVLTSNSNESATASLYGAGNNTSNYTTKLNKIKTFYSNLSKNYKTLNSEKETLKEKNESLSASNKSLKSKNQKLEEKNQSLTEKYESLKTSNSDLKGQVSSLKNTNSNLKNQVSNSSGVQRVPVQNIPASQSTTAVQNTSSAPAKTQSVEQEKASITITPSENKKESKSEKADKEEESETAEETVEEVTEEPEVNSIELEDTNTGLDFNATADDVTESDVIDSSVTEEEESSGSILPIVIIIVIFLAVVGAIVFFLVVKPRLDSTAEEEDDDEDETP